MSHRYYVYSIEAGTSPHEPWYESDSLQSCIDECRALSRKYDVTSYVVDRKPLTMYEEVFVCISSDFSACYNETRERIRKLRSMPP